MNVLNGKNKMGKNNPACSILILQYCQLLSEVWLE